MVGAPGRTVARSAWTSRMVSPVEYTASGMIVAPNSVHTRKPAL